MIKHIPSIVLSFAGMVLLTLLTGCSGTSPNQDGADLLDRVNSLEQRVQTLEMQQTALEQRHREDIDALREDLKNILEYVHIALDNMTRTGDLEKELGDVGESARRSFKEKLKELLDLSQEMIDRLERDLKEQDDSGLTQ